jgi:hypothetical protein
MGSDKRIRNSASQSAADIAQQVGDPQLIGLFAAAR